MECKETISWLEVYIDGELEEPKRLEIEKHLKNCASCALLKENKFAFYSAIGSSSLYFKTPAGLEERIHGALKREQEKIPKTEKALSWFPKITFWAPLTALALVILMNGHGIFSLRQDDLAQDVISSHVRSLMVDHLVDVQTSDQHVVKPWFNGKLDFSPQVLDFSKQGFPLAGGRLDYLAHRSVVALVYHRNLHPINLFIWPSKNEKEIPPKVLSIQGYNLVHWSANGMTYWAVSDLNLQELKTFIDFVQRG
jgi:anti-sigma factor RsiW